MRTMDRASRWAEVRDTMLFSTIHRSHSRVVGSTEDAGSSILEHLGPPRDPRDLACLVDDLLLRRDPLLRLAHGLRDRPRRLRAADRTAGTRRAHRDLRRLRVRPLQLPLPLLQKATCANRVVPILMSGDLVMDTDMDKIESTISLCGKSLNRRECAV